MSFIAYYYHWSGTEIERLPHAERRRWCREISAVNRSLSAAGTSEKSIMEWKLT